MSRKFLVMGLASLFLLYGFLLTKSGVQAQSNDYASVYHKTAHEDYVLKRAQYLRFKTQTSASNAIDSTIVMLQARDQATIDYLKSLKARLNEAKGIDDQVKNELRIKLDEEIQWFGEHKAKLSSANSLEDVVADSNLAKTEFGNLDSVIYQSLSEIAFGKTVDYQSRLTDILNTIKDKISKIKNEQREDYSFSVEKLQTIDRWLFESENHLDRSTQKQVSAQEFLARFNLAARVGGPDLYSNILLNSNDSKQYIRETGTYLKEVVREIKTAE